MSGEDELETSQPSEPDSSQEKMMAFQCLSDAIEEVKGNLTEQQYMALYSAALWCFNLTPHWAEGRPTPPEPNANQGGNNDACASTGGSGGGGSQHGSGAGVVGGGVGGGEEGGSGAGPGASDEKSRVRRRRRRPRSRGSLEDASVNDA